MESLPIPVGYGVELATLMDTVSAHGLDAVAQVDLGSRGHRHQANHDLALMAAELLLVAERRRLLRRARSAEAAEPAGHPPATSWLRQFVRDDRGQVHPVTRPVPVTERPPAASVHLR
jgi:glucosyl-3-phosphoglycerate synthase